MGYPEHAKLEGADQKGGDHELAERRVTKAPRRRREAADSEKVFSHLTVFEI